MSEVEYHKFLVIGGGPAGLSAAMSAEDNGIDTLVLDATELGGQAATATHIDNYPGFPNGVSGPDLIGGIVDQALKYSTEFEAPARVINVTSTDEGILATTDEGVQYLGGNALLAIGLEPCKLKARNLAAYINRGVHYGTPEHIDDIDSAQKICIVGGSDAAAQTAVDLAENGNEVDLIVRGKDLRGRVRQSIIKQVEQHPSINLRCMSQVISVDGSGCLERITVRSEIGETQDILTQNLFILIGSQPRTLWLPDTVAKDKRGFVLTGSLIDEKRRNMFMEQSDGRPPYNHETSMPGLFAAGDIRSGIRKMVTFAILDGASVIPELQELEVSNKLNT